MGDNEKLYHKANVFAIPGLILIALVGFPLGILVNAGDPLILSYIALGLDALWVVISGILNDKVRDLVLKGVRFSGKLLAGMVGGLGCGLIATGLVGVFLAAIVVTLLAFFLMYFSGIGVIVLAIYLWVTSYKALKADRSVFI